MSDEVVIDETTVEVQIEPLVVEVLIEPPPPVEIELTSEATEVVIEQPPAFEIEITASGPQGPPGAGATELYDSNTPDPVGAPFPYLRFERDIDGDVQAIFLGTAT